MGNELIGDKKGIRYSETVSLTSAFGLHWQKFQSLSLRKMIAIVGELMV